MARNPHAGEETTGSIQITGVLSGGNLCSVAESRRDDESGNTMPW